MAQFCGAHRMPRAGERIADAATALGIVHLAMSVPARTETVVVLLDADRCGRTVVVIDGTTDADAVVEVVEHITGAMAAAGDPGAIVVASIRPARGPDPRDGDRWLEASDLAEQAGVELIEWFVVDTGDGEPVAWCPRDLLAEPPRWSP